MIATGRKVACASMTERAIQKGIYLNLKYKQKSDKTILSLFIMQFFALLRLVID